MLGIPRSICQRSSRPTRAHPGLQHFDVLVLYGMPEPMLNLCAAHKYTVRTWAAARRDAPQPRAHPTPTLRNAPLPTAVHHNVPSSPPSPRLGPSAVALLTPSLVLTS